MQLSIAGWVKAVNSTRKRAHRRAARLREAEDRGGGEVRLSRSRRVADEPGVVVERIRECVGLAPGHPAFPCEYQRDVPDVVGDVGPFPVAGGILEEPDELGVRLGVQRCQVADQPGRVEVCEPPVQEADVVLLRLGRRTDQLHCLECATRGLRGAPRCGASEGDRRWPPGHDGSREGALLEVFDRRSGVDHVPALVRDRTRDGMGDGVVRRDRRRTGGRLRDGVTRPPSGTSSEPLPNDLHRVSGGD